MPLGSINAVTVVGIICCWGFWGYYEYPFYQTLIGFLIGGVISSIILSPVLGPTEAFDGIVILIMLSVVGLLIGMFIRSMVNMDMNSART